jgi:hypothetical protein
MGMRRVFFDTSRSYAQGKPNWAEPMEKQNKRRWQWKRGESRGKRRRAGGGKRPNEWGRGVEGETEADLVGVRAAGRARGHLVVLVLVERAGWRLGSCWCFQAVKGVEQPEEEVDLTRARADQGSRRSQGKQVEQDGSCRKDYGMRENNQVSLTDGANNPNEKHGTAAGGALRRLRPRHAVSFPCCRVQQPWQKPSKQVQQSIQSIGKSFWKLRAPWIEGKNPSSLNFSMSFNCFLWNSWNRFGWNSSISNNASNFG